MSRIISIQNRLVDLSLCYSISPVFGDNCWANNDEGHDYLKHSYYSFTMSFINNHELKFGESTSNLFKTELYREEKETDVFRWFFDKEVYLRYDNLARERIRAFRQRVYEMWAQTEERYTNINP